MATSKSSGKSYRMQLVRLRLPGMEGFRDIDLYVPGSTQVLPEGHHEVEFPVRMFRGKLEVGFPVIREASGAVKPQALRG